MYTDAIAFELPDFKGVYRCDNFILVIREEEEKNE
jgi:hypothetical protein